MSCQTSQNIGDQYNSVKNVLIGQIDQKSAPITSQRGEKNDKNETQSSIQQQAISLNLNRKEIALNVQFNENSQYFNELETKLSNCKSQYDQFVYQIVTNVYSNLNEITMIQDYTLAISPYPTDFIIPDQIQQQKELNKKQLYEFFDKMSEWKNKKEIFSPPIQTLLFKKLSDLFPKNSIDEKSCITLIIDVTLS